MSSEVQKYQPNSFGGMQKVWDGRWVMASDYAALEAENARLTAQLAAIQGGMGAVVKLKRPGAWKLFSKHYREGFNEAEAQHQRITAAMAAEVERVGKDYETAREAHDRVLSEMQDIKIKAQEVTDYHVRLLASALGECIQAAGISAPGVSLSGPQLLMFAVDLKETVIALRAELAEVKSSGWRNHSVNYARAEKCPQTLEAAQAAWDRDQELIEEQRTEIAKHKQTINQLRQRTPASPDVEGLVKALEDCAGRLRLLIDSGRHKMLDAVAEEKARTALSTWRQAHTPSTLPASSAEE